MRFIKIAYSISLHQTVQMHKNRTIFEGQIWTKTTSQGDKQRQNLSTETKPHLLFICSFPHLTDGDLMRCDCVGDGWKRSSFP